MDEALQSIHVVNETPGNPHPPGEPARSPANAPDRPDDLPGKIVAALDRLARGRRSHRQSLAWDRDLSPLQVEVLLVLADGLPPRPTVGLLAVELGVTQPTVTDSVQALAAKGLVVRSPDPADRRRSLVALTPGGRRVVTAVRAAEASLAADVSALPEEHQTAVLESLLELIAGQLRAGVIDVARTCGTCMFFEDDGEVRRCALLDVVLEPADLRVNCPEHRVA